jgi:hypothetical protein
LRLCAGGPTLQPDLIEKGVEEHPGEKSR